ncbi:MAG: uroporphyrinogen decarboxylase/cobalamine-independent methonine synthase family protein [Planctomycetota bacterium]|jgi:hypothetical protein
MSIKPKFLATGIGSMPFEDVSHAVDMSLSNFSQAPYWPQLPRLGLTEQMNVQYTEGMPCAVVDKDQNRIYFETSGDYSDALARFYEKYLTAMDPDSGNGDCSAMAISPDYSKGIYAFEERLKGKGEKLPLVKVQTTGPCSLTLSVTDEKKQFIYYNNELREMAVKALAMKCRWQIQKFVPYAERVICFIDEPILSAYGSSTYVAVSRESVVAMLAEVIEAVAADGAISGVHCCGNTEWSIPIDAGADIVNFDAFEFGETIARYPDDVKKHLQKGRMLAWGVVPTSPAIREHDTESLTAYLEKMMDTLAAKGIDKQLIIEQALVTPSCGTGAMEPADAEKVFKLTDAVSKAMREKYGF